MIKKFLLEESGQDLVEYSLLLAFVVLASAALFIGSGVQIAGIWSQANTELVNANTAAAS
jgi:Flp pilus assembly pilin Flp